MKFKLSLAIILTLTVLCISGTVFAMTETERQTLIAQIQAQIAQLLQQLVQLQVQDQTWCHNFNTNLDRGDIDPEVAALQTALIKEGFTISASEIQNQQFGTTTGQAVKDFKAKYSSQIVTSGTTKVGKITRGMLNQLYGCAITIPTCTPNWRCGSWSACSNGQQTRTCTDLNNCGTTINRPALTQSCALTPVCTASNWIYTLSPSVCPSSGSQTKTWTKIGTCSEGVTHPARETVTCVYQANTCTSFAYSNWSECFPSGVQTRTVTSSSPSGCTGGNPILSRACTYYTCTPNWSCGSWSACSNGQQTRTCTDLNNCGVLINKPQEAQNCSTFVPTTAICGNAITKTYLLPYKSQYTPADLNNDTLCSIGTAGPISAPSGVGNEISWVCHEPGLLDANCWTTITIIKDSVCGTAAKNYPSTATSYGSDTFCQAGFINVPSSEYIEFPKPGSYTTWSCDLLPNYVMVMNCTATVAAIPCLSSWDCPGTDVCSSLNTCFSVPSSCQDDWQCRFGICVGGNCGRCLTTADCRSKEMECVGASGSWTPGGTPPIYGTCTAKSCTSNSDCDSIRICVQGVCQNPS
jgi:hypothetical protein